MASLAVSDECKVHSAPLQATGQVAQEFVRLTPERLSDLSDEELQAYIQRTAELFMASQREWEESGDFAAVGRRDFWWQAEAEALKERGSRQRIVARMEKELGLS